MLPLEVRELARIPDNFEKALALMDAHPKPVLNTWYTPRVRRYLLFPLLLAGNQLLHRFGLYPKPSRWWNGITDELVLGALPLRGQEDNIIEAGVTAILSVVQPFELEPAWWFRPVDPATWKDKGLEQNSVSTPDLEHMSFQTLHTCVSQLVLNTQNGKKTYVHCKAGKTRSASCVISFLACHRGYSLEEATTFVRERRPIIHLRELAPTVSMYKELFDRFHPPSKLV